MKNLDPPWCPLRTVSPYQCTSGCVPEKDVCVPTFASAPAADTGSQS